MAHQAALTVHENRDLLCENDYDTAISRQAAQEFLSGDRRADPRKRIIDGRTCLPDWAGSRGHGYEVFGSHPRSLVALKEDGLERAKSPGVRRGNTK